MEEVVVEHKLPLEDFVEASFWNSHGSFHHRYLRSMIFKFRGSFHWDIGTSVESCTTLIYVPRPLKIRGSFHLELPWKLAPPLSTFYDL